MNKELRLNWEEFAQGAGHWLELFDKFFASEAVPIHARPLKSAMWMVQDAIPELPYGDSKDEHHFQKEWFSALVIAIRKWYENRYGVDATKPDKSLLPGLVMIYGTPTRLAIRETISKVEVEGEKAWCIWPDAVHETETTLSFVPLKPNLETMQAQERKMFEKNVANAVGCTRSISLALHSASDLPDEGRQMVPGIMRHIEKAVEDILTLKTSNAAVGIWELHLAVEKTFKVYLYQNGSRFEKHDLQTLFNQAKTHGLNVSQSLLKKLPHWKQSSNFRYAEQEASLDYAVEIYYAAILLIREISSQLRRVIVLNNAGFLLQRPKWVGQD